MKKLSLLLCVLFVLTLSGCQLIPGLSPEQGNGGLTGEMAGQLAGAIIDEALNADPNSAQESTMSSDSADGGLAGIFNGGFSGIWDSFFGGADHQDENPFGNVVALPGGAQEQDIPYDSTDSQTVETLNGFLSAFVETGLTGFDREVPDYGVLLQFVRTHTMFRNRSSIGTTADGSQYYLPVAEADRIIATFFGMTVEHPLPVSQGVSYTEIGGQKVYAWPCADGDFATEVAIVSNSFSAGVDNQFFLDFEVYTLNDVFTASVDDYYLYSADQAKSDGNLSWVASGTALVSYESGTYLIESIQVDR